MIDRYVCPECNKYRLLQRRLDREENEEVQPVPSTSRQSTSEQNREALRELSVNDVIEGLIEDVNTEQDTSATEVDDILYPINSILNAGYSEDKVLMYYVKYRAGDKSWQPYYNLVSCKDKVEEFHKKYPHIKMPSIKFIDRYGSSQGEQVNYANFKAMDDIDQAIKVYGTKERPSLKKDINVLFPNEKLRGNEDHIEVIGLENHCVVALKYIRENKAYVAEAENILQRDKGLKAKLVEHLKGYNVIIIPYANPSGNDHCASAAVIATIMFKQSYSTGCIPRAILALKKLRENLVKHFHKEPTISLLGNRDIKKLAAAKRQQCVNCNEWFANRQKFVTHSRFCK